MTDEIQRKHVPSNMDLAREAGRTVDEKRQILLAQHPSRIVKRALATNKALCEEAVKILGNELDSLCQEFHKQAMDRAKVFKTD